MQSVISEIEIYKKGRRWIKHLGLSINQIELIECYYYPNKAKQFPKALREMLFLLGGTTAFDTGCKLYHNEENTKDLDILLKSQKKQWLTDKQSQYFINNRPIWVFDTFPNTDNDKDFSFVYLDEEEENPFVWRFLIHPCYKQLFVQNGGYDHREGYVEKIRLVDYAHQKMKNYNR